MDLCPTQHPPNTLDATLTGQPQLPCDQAKEVQSLLRAPQLLVGLRAPRVLSR